MEQNIERPAAGQWDWMAVATLFRASLWRELPRYRGRYSCDAVDNLRRETDLFLDRAYGGLAEALRQSEAQVNSMHQKLAQMTASLVDADQRLAAAQVNSRQQATSPKRALDKALCRQDELEGELPQLGAEAEAASIRSEAERCAANTLREAADLAREAKARTESALTEARQQAVELAILTECWVRALAGAQAELRSELEASAALLRVSDRLPLEDVPSLPEASPIDLTEAKANLPARPGRRPRRGAVRATSSSNPQVTG